MTDSESKNRRGGRREGAGRPGTDSKIYSLRLPGPIAQIVDIQESKTEFIKECIVRTVSNGLLDIYPATRIKDLSLPYFDVSVVAGFPVPLDNDERSQDINLLSMLCPHPESCYLIRVNGESMIDAGIHSGDIVIVDKSNRTPGPHDIAMCELNGEYTLKRYQREGDHGWLIPANPDFTPIEITQSDQFSIWGTVTYIIHRPKD